LWPPLRPRLQSAERRGDAGCWTRLEMGRDGGEARGRLLRKKQTHSGDKRPIGRTDGTRRVGRPTSPGGVLGGRAGNRPNGVTRRRRRCGPWGSRRKLSGRTGAAQGLHRTLPQGRKGSAAGAHGVLSRWVGRTDASEARTGAEPEEKRGCSSCLPPGRRSCTGRVCIGPHPGCSGPKGSAKVRLIADSGQGCPSVC